MDKEGIKRVLRENRECLDKYWSDYWKTKEPLPKVESGLKEIKIYWEMEK